MAPTPPRPPKRPVLRDLHGVERVDDYDWMCDVERSDPEVLEHLEAENAYVAEVMADTVELQETLFAEIKGRVKETDMSVPAYDRGWWYYARSVEGAQYPVYCRLAADGESDPPDPDAPDVLAREQVLLDLNVEAGDGDYFSLGVFDVSPDATMLAWAADRNGSELHELRFRPLVGPDTGVDLPDVVQDVYYSSAWSADGAHFFYTRPDRAMRPHQVWRHDLETTAEHLVHQEDDERFFCNVSTTKDEEWIVVSMGSAVTSEIRVCRSERVGDDDFETVVPRRQGIEAELEHLDGTFYVLTNDEALDFRIVEAPVAAALAATSEAAASGADPGGPDAFSFDDWTDTVAHRPGVRIEDVDVLRGRLIVSERTEATTRAIIHDIAAETSFQLERDEDPSTVVVAGNGDLDWPQLRYTYTSMVTPPTVIDLDLNTGERHVRKVQPVLGGYDPGDYVTRRLWATADDGTQVPISLVHRRDRTEPGPTLLYGYGSYEISIDPGFSSARLSLLDRGWAFAIGHPRGGGEMGRGWYEDGKLAAKPNTFDDFVACGQTLIDEGVASPNQIAIRGGSAGGLLVGAALNRAPDLWAAVVAEVPFVDALTTICDPALPLTVIEWEEWGNPLESPEIFSTMAGYTPYETIPAEALPPVLATAGLHDPRVGYWEPAKWVARLRDRTEGIAGAGPFLLRTELGAGHGGPSGRYDAWRDEALVLAFLLSTVGSGAP